jgi:hypothetical protein
MLPPDWTQTEHTEFLVRRRRLIAKVIREGFQQLSDPNYVPDLSTEEQVGAEPIDLPSFEELVVSGVIPTGAALTAGAGVSSGWTFWEFQLADGSGPQSLANIRNQVHRGWTAAPSA